MKRTDIAQKQVDISGKRQAMEEQMFKINARAKHVEMAKGFLPNVSQDNYDDFVKWNKENEVPDVAFKSAEEVGAMTPEQFEQYKTGLDKTAEKDLKLTGVIKQFYDLKGRLPVNEAEMSKFQTDISKKSSPQKDIKTFVKDGTTYKQDRIFDKDSGTYKNVGEPYESKEGVNLTVNTGVEKTTRTKLEEGVISGEKNLDMLARLDDMYDESFLKYTGKAQAGAEDILSKAGLSEGEYLQKRAKWASEVDTFTLLWRKHITGVAGGPQEMKAIEKTVINTKYDSPAKYKAKREQMEIMTKAAVAKDKAYLANGIDLKKMTPEQREVISQTDPLTNYYPTAQKGIDNLYEKFGLEK